MSPTRMPARLAVVGRDETEQRDVLGRERVPGPVKLSIMMPAYDEQQTIGHAVARVLEASLPCDFELIIVDDGSADGTRAILAGLRHPKAKVIAHPRNLGKGAALQTAAAVASGTHLVPFDADLEYDPRDLADVMMPIIQGRADVVYGTRLFGVNTRYQSYRQAVGNRALTFAANVLFDSYLSDMHTCVKVLPVELFRQLDLSEQGFGLDTEITANLLRRGIRPFEVPISYHSRSAANGKKITWRDGVGCLHVLARARLRNPRPRIQASIESSDVVANSIRRLSEIKADATDDRAARPPMALTQAATTRDAADY